MPLSHPESDKSQALESRLREIEISSRVPDLLNSKTMDLGILPRLEKISDQQKGPEELSPMKLDTPFSLVIYSPSLN